MRRRKERRYGMDGGKRAHTIVSSCPRRWKDQRRRGQMRGPHALDNDGGGRGVVSDLSQIHDRERRVSERSSLGTDAFVH